MDRASARLGPHTGVCGLAALGLATVNTSHDVHRDANVGRRAAGVSALLHPTCASRMHAQ
jgi:hypothetical protein